jgi:hypothetical protein
VSASSDDYALPLGFALRTCDQCGGERQVAFSCRACGAQPAEDEADDEFDRRQRIADRVRSRASDLEPSVAQSIHSLLARAGGIVRPYMSALADLSSGGEDSTALLNAAIAVDQLGADLSLPQPRPWSAPGRALAAAVANLAEALDLFLDAFGARDVADARDLGRRAQEKLDAAGLHAHQLGDRIHELGRLIESDAAEFVDLATYMIFGEDRSEVLRSGDVLEADRLGESRAQRIVGADESIAPGVGFALLWNAATAEVIFDEERYYWIAQSAYRVFRDCTVLPSLTTDPLWQTNEAQAQADVASSARALEALLTAARHDRDHVRAVLLYVQDLFEGPGKHLVATLAACTSSRDYRRQVNDDAGGLVTRVSQGRHGDLLAGLASGMRHASAHLDFALDGDVIVLKPGEHETRLDATWFWDGALASAEAVSAIAVGLMAAIAQRQLTQPFNLDAVTSEMRVRIIMASSGFQEISLSTDGSSAAIEASGELAKPMALVGPLLAVLPEVTDTLAIRVH